MLSKLGWVLAPINMVLGTLLLDQGKSVSGTLCLSVGVSWLMSHLAILEVPRGRGGDGERSCLGTSQSSTGCVSPSGGCKSSAGRASTPTPPSRGGVMECTRCGILHVPDPPPEPSAFARTRKYLKGVVGWRK